eukprot:1601768-Rhodomonas_salina.1
MPETGMQFSVHNLNYKGKISTSTSKIFLITQQRTVLWPRRPGQLVCIECKFMQLNNSAAAQHTSKLERGTLLLVMALKNAKQNVQTLTRICGHPFEKT